MTDHDDDQLEAAFRDGLQRLGEGADVTTPVAARAGAAARRRRQGRAVIGVAAASVAAIAIAGFAVSRGGSDTPADVPIADSPPEPGQGVTEWRTEYWHDLQVDVPADWGYGAAPVGRGDALCGAPHDTAYVGRPIALTDVCFSVDAAPPTAPYVWLGADIAPGTADVGNGYTQETVVVAGTTLTVATAEPALRATIIDSATEGELCPPELDRVPEGRFEFTIEGVGDLQQARVCAYGEVSSAAHELVAASDLALRDFERMGAALEEAPQEMRLCKHVPEFVVVTGWYADPYTDDRSLWLRHDAVFELSCGVVDRGTSQLSSRFSRVRATPESIDSWRSELFETSLYHFIGPQG